MLSNKETEELHMETMINEKMIIDDVQLVEEELSRLAGMEVSLEQMKINSQDHRIFYLDKNLNKTDEKNSCYAWLDSGYKTGKNERIFISLVSFDDYCCGHFVGTAAYLANGVCKRKNGHSRNLIKHNAHKLEVFCDKNNSNKKIVSIMSNNIILEMKPDCPKNELQYKISHISEKNQHDLCDEIAETIFENLKFPNWKSVEGLKRFLKIIGYRLQQLIEQKKTDYYLENKVGAIVNTGLIDKFGEDYIIYYKIHFNKENKMYKPESIVTSRKFYEENGFYDQPKSLKTISFYDNEEIFRPSLKDVDLCSRNLNHVINERNERFPENWQSATESQKAIAIKNAIKFGITMQERDPFFAKAIYSTECEKISWLFPLYLNSDFPDDPELVMVLRTTGNFIEVKTILPYNDEVKDRIRAVNLYRNVW